MAISPGASESSLQHGETVLRGTGRAATNLGPRVSTAGTNTSAGSTGICTATGMATILRLGIIDVPFFPTGWLMKIEGLLETPEKQQLSMMIDGINQLPAPLFLPF